MKKIVAGILIALAVSALTSAAGGAEAPVLLTHDLTGYRVEGKTVTAEYLLHVTNRLDKPLSELTLTYFPNILRKERIVLKVATLDAEASVDLPFRVTGKALPPKRALQRQMLPFGAEGRDAEGKVVEFPVTSYPGGPL